MKKILFIPTYTYLSSPIFNSLLHELRKYETLYLDIEDQYFSERTSEKFKNQFRRIIKLHTNVEGNGFFIKVRKFFNILRYKSRLKDFIAQEVPNLIITTSDLTFSIRVIKLYFPNIPIVIIQPALFTNSGRPRTFLQKITYMIFNNFLNFPLVSRQNYFGQEFNDVFLLLWGEYFNNMASYNKNIHIVGDMTLDDFPIKVNRKLKDNLLEKEGLDSDTKIITICTNAFNGLITVETEEKLYRIYQDLIVMKQDILFIIKPHPRNNGEKLRNIFNVLDVSNILISDEHIHQLLQYTDIHISSFSRTSMEALAFGVPILSVNPNNEISLEDFWNNDMNEKVSCLEEAVCKIDTILHESSDFFSLREQYIEKMLYKLDGNSTVRALAIIENELVLNG